ncbi:MAG: DUF5668 domain-containing protein [Patescibacteria group bacterium]
MRAGLILVFVGTLFLLDRFGLLNGIQWNIIWPVFIILLGLSIMLRHDGCNCKGCVGGKCCGHGLCREKCVGACKNGKCETCEA